MTFIYLNITLILFLLVLTFGPNRFTRLYRNTTLFVVLTIWISSINLWLDCSWYKGIAMFVDASLNEFNIHCLFKIDTLSLFFVLLTTFIFPFCVLAVWELPVVRVLFINLLLIELFLILTFTVYDLFLFCLFFEAVLIPMFFIILWWGSRLRRIKALTYFFIYTIFGSVFLFLALFICYFETGSTSIFSLYVWVYQFGLVYEGYFLHNFLWLLFFFVFAIKVPMFPFHIWLPEAHVEAPTVGSVILAALLLKLGGYGILRFLYIFSYQFVYWQPLTFFLILLSVWLGSISALRQLDLKRTIAYSSIAHMNFALAGFFSNAVLGVVGGFSMLLSHGFVSAALFLLIGFIYDRYHTRTIPYYGGLVQVMPVWVFFFFFFTISNFSFPGTSNFIGEVLIFTGLGMSNVSFFFLLAMAISTLLTVAYSIFLFNRISFGTLKMQYITAFSDLNRREVMLMLPLFLINIFFGLVPNFFLAPIYNAVLVYFSRADDLFASDFWFETNIPTHRVLLSPVDELAINATVDITLTHYFFWELSKCRHTGVHFLVKDIFSIEGTINLIIGIDHEERVHQNIEVFGSIKFPGGFYPTHNIFNSEYFSEIHRTNDYIFEILRGVPEEATDTYKFFMEPLAFIEYLSIRFKAPCDKMIYDREHTHFMPYVIDLRPVPGVKKWLIDQNVSYDIFKPGEIFWMEERVAIDYDNYFLIYYLPYLKKEAEILAGFGWSDKNILW